MPSSSGRVRAHQETSPSLSSKGEGRGGEGNFLACYIVQQLSFGNMGCMQGRENHCLRETKRSTVVLVMCVSTPEDLLDSLICNVNV